MSTNRTFLNERTDLTATEVSPRLHAAEIIDRPSGKVVKINTRKVKLSLEKNSIRILNVNSRVKVNRQKIMDNIS